MIEQLKSANAALRAELVQAEVKINSAQRRDNRFASEYAKLEAERDKWKQSYEASHRHHVVCIEQRGAAVAKCAELISAARLVLDMAAVWNLDPSKSLNTMNTAFDTLRSSLDSPDAGKPLLDELAALRSRVEQRDVQLAGCLTAAEGFTSNPAKQTDYGWSPAYQETLELRLKYDALRTELESTKEELQEMKEAAIAIGKHMRGEAAGGGK